MSGSITSYSPIQLVGGGTSGQALVWTGALWVPTQFDGSGAATGLAAVLTDLTVVLGIAPSTGIQGPAGAVINSGTVDTTGHLSLFRSDGTTIAVAGTIVGAQGPAGTAGAQGPAGAAGAPGAPGAQGPAGAQGPQGPAGLAGGAGAVINSGTVTSAGALSLIRSDGTTIAVAGTIVGATGPAGAAGAAGPQGLAGSAGAAGAAGPAINSGSVDATGHLTLLRSDGTTIAVAGTLVGSGASITSLSSTGTIASGDLVGISQGGTDHNVSYANFLNGETGDQLAAAAPVSATDTFLTLQGGSTTQTQPASAIWAWIASSQLRTYKRPVIELTGSPAVVTLDGTVHNGCDLICSGAVTLNPSGTMGSGFECRVFNVSGSNVTFGSGFTTDTGASVLATGFAANIDVMAYLGGTLTFAKLGGGTSIVTPPGQVTGLAAGAITYNSVALSWSAPGSGGAPSSYTVGYRVTSVGGAFSTISVSGTSATVTGLAASTGYDFQVTAVNAAGSGTASAIAAASTIAAPSTAPGPVTSLAAGTPGATSIPLSWAAPTTGGAVSSYTVNYRTTGSSPWTAFATGITGLSSTVTGLSSATGYDFQVLSINGVGQGSATVSATTGASLAAPGQAGTPTASAVTATGLTLTWTAPGSGGAVATYTVQSSPTGANTWTNQASGVTTLSTALTGLSAATTYDFRVIAVNATGSGTPSGTVTQATASYAPNTPTGLTAGTAASTTMPFTWTAPATDGTHSAATGYVIQYRVTSVGGAFTQVTVGNVTSYTVTGLTAGTQYDFQIDATNSGGASAFTATVNATTATSNYLLSAGYAPTYGSSVSHTTSSLACNVNDHGSVGDGSYTIPASSRLGFSTSNTVAPTSWTTGAALSNGGHHYQSAYLPGPFTVGANYLWCQAFDSGSNLVATYVSTGTITVT